MSEFIISVCVITYGQERYIRQTLKGILSQEANFVIELIIANDNSPDNSDSLIQEFIKNNQNANFIIRYFKHENNIGAMPNFKFALEKCSGKYIAICEGDDYWTDPLKLQKQVDFLEANSDYTLHFHNAMDIVEDYEEIMISSRESGVVTSKEIIQKKVNIPTLSMMFSYIILFGNLELISNARAGDRVLEILCVINGKAYYENEVMGIKNTLATGELAKFKKEGVSATIKKYESNLALLDNLKESQRKFMYDYLFRVGIQICKQDPSKISYLIKSLLLKFKLI